MFKNTSGQKFRVFAFNTTTNEPVTGDAANITGKIAKDYGAATAITDTNPTEVEDGYYLFDLTQAETNASVLDIYPESSTADVQVIGVPGTVYTQPPNFPDLAVTSSTGRVTVGTNADKTGYSISGTKTTLDNLNDLSQANVRTAVGLASANLDDQLSTIDGNVDLVLEDTGTTLPSTLTTIAAYLDTEIALILEDTGTTLPGLINGLNDLSASDIANELGTYDAPTRAELTTDINSVLSKMLKYVQLMTRSDAAIATDNATELTAINANGGSGAGDYSNQDDAIEALRDRGDSAWITVTATAIRSAVGLGAANLDTQFTALATYIDTEVAAILEDTGTTLPAQISALNNVSTAQVRTQVDNALIAIHLDHLLATDYDPASKPGVSTALFNELIVSDSGVSQFSTNALENAPGGGGSVTVGDITSAALAKFLTTDTGETEAVDGSVGKIAQGAAGGNVTVASFTGDAADQLDEIQSKTLLISSGVITVVSSVSRNGAVRIVKGDDYNDDDGRAIDFINSGGDWPDLTGATVQFIGEDAVESDGSDFTASMSVVIAEGNNQTVRLELTDTQTNTLDIGNFDYSVKATLTSGNIVTLQKMTQGLNVSESP